ncbi:MAG TPA: hypothetical protein VK810_05950 [Dongiaceae bacterium]|nr:hypothetical protein [Dongiaceae bacterium]
MKTIFPFFAIAILVCGCNKSVVVPPVVQPSPKPIQWEYKVVMDSMPPVIDAVAVAKTDLAEAQKELAEAKADEKSASGQISQTDAIAATNDAETDLELKQLTIKIDQEDGIRSNLLQSITDQGTNSWELVSANISPEKPDKFILIFKRPSQ